MSFLSLYSKTNRGIDNSPLINCCTNKYIGFLSNTHFYPTFSKYFSKLQVGLINYKLWDLTGTDIPLYP